MGFEAEIQREDFDLDEDEPLRAIRNERDFDALVARSLNDHWSVGGRASIDSSSFDNIALRVFGGPAVEYNFFPYSQYTRRQLRFGYAIGPYRARYVEETLFFKMSGRAWCSSSPRSRSISASHGDRSRPSWNTRRFFPTRRATAFSSKATSTSGWRADCRCRSRAPRAASAIRLSIPRRGVTEEEVLLRLRRLRSGYEYNLQIGLTYTFGSIFNTIVNPRFGQ